MVGAAMAAVMLWVAPLQADLDPNDSHRFPDEGYGVIICGNTLVFEDPNWANIVKALLRDCFKLLTQDFNFDPDNVWVLVDNGEDDWTEGLFDALPADQPTIASSFQTLGERMWSDTSTPRNLIVLIAGHGTEVYGDPPLRMKLELADGLIYDHDFVDNLFNQINNNSYNGSPIERLDMLITVCSGGGMINDFRDNFHDLRGSTWPNAHHITTLTAGDWRDTTTAMFGVTMLANLRNGGIHVPDLDGDGALSIYEYYEWAARRDPTNPGDPYTPDVPETIYIPGEAYLPLGYREHPLYYEWNAFPVVTLKVDIVQPNYGEVEMVPAPSHPDYAPQYLPGTEVELTPVPLGAWSFQRWELFDPNHPDDANYIVVDTSNPLTIMMDTDRRVRAVFGCGPGVEQALPLLAAAALVCGFISRRMRRRGERKTIA